MERSGRGVVQKRREETINRSEYMKEKLEELQGNKTSILRGLN